ncbi:CLAVATA3/ESR (CLE)-related protein ESR1-like [Panicum miliaceum]|uniref:CLAVATA3/ESR (CLE)-related protein ESR1-like n=1 Tax=Panicum miliaceum TaxID=4540 RepID=A0A3L6PCC9_PANMI|nr:CLAVATA3/ESR (CLE)-related protein ESR1-like [Panicum miliaceum]
MASSRTIAMVAAAVFLVCTIMAWTPEAGRMGQRGEVVAAAGVDGGGGSGNVPYWEQQQQEFIGRRPRLASFTRRDGVALPNGQVAAGGEDGGSKREVPSGPDPIHHPGAPSSAAPTTP